jgi:hypothetical protein
MSSNRIEIFKKASMHFKKASNHAFLKNLAFPKKKPRGNCRIATMASFALDSGSPNFFFVVDLISNQTL